MLALVRSTGAKQGDANMAPNETVAEAELEKIDEPMTFAQTEDEN